MPNATVLSRAYEILRVLNATTIFGNPGSNEVSFIADLPDDFRYIQCLHEGIAVSMAEGYAQSIAGPAVVNLHSSSGSGNGIGMLSNAHYSHTPLIVLAGQQVRDQVGLEIMLTNPDAAVLTKPITKWSYEPLAAQDVPRAISNAVHAALTEPRGPTYLSVPWDDWTQTAHPDDVLLTSRSIRTGGRLGPLISEVAAQLDGWQSPLIVLGGDVDAARAQDSAVELAERLGAEVWVAPSASRCPFPTTHVNFRGVLEPSRKRIHERLEGHDGLLVIGAPLFRYHQHQPAPYLPDAGVEVVHLAVDPAEAARAPFGNSIVCSIGPALADLAAAVKNRGTTVEPRVIPPTTQVPGQMTSVELLDIIAASTPDGVAYVNEVTSMSDAFMSRVPISGADGYKLCAAGGLGFGMAAAVGTALARPDDTVVAAIGDGSAQYSIQALYTAAMLGSRVVFVIFNNAKYGAVEHFANAMGYPSAPGLELPGIDFVALAEGYGVPASRAGTLHDFEREYAAALNKTGPILIEAEIAFT